jgi:RNA polymerase sigma-70 factor (sigma-E family)
MRRADEDRFREFARSQAGVLRRSAFLLCGDWHLADDLVQQSLIKLYGAWPRVTRTERPTGYVRKILMRCWLDEWRRAWHRAELTVVEVPDHGDDRADPTVRQEQDELRAELFDALAAVPPRQRAVLVLRYYEAFSVAETAEMLGCTEGTVKSQAARGLVTMKAALGESLPHGFVEEYQ